MAISAPQGQGGMFWEINITPLTDIFLVLLIIFMVTASVAVESATHIDLPTAESTTPENKGVIVTYTANHELFVNSRDVPEREFEPALHDALGRVDAKIVIFQGDRTVLLGDMVRILDIAKAAGASTIAIAARRISGPEPLSSDSKPASNLSLTQLADSPARLRGAPPSVSLTRLADSPARFAALH